MRKINIFLVTKNNWPKIIGQKNLNTENLIIYHNKYN